MRILNPPGWPRPRGYSNGIEASGRTIYTAGVVGWDEREMFPSHTLEGQFDQALRNTLAILREGRAGPEHVVRMTIYITDRSEYLRQRDEIGAVWKSHMGAHYPAMAMLIVAGLIEPTAKVEIETTAVVPE